MLTLQMHPGHRVGGGECARERGINTTKEERV